MIKSWICRVISLSTADFYYRMDVFKILMKVFRTTFGEFLSRNIFVFLSLMYFGHLVSWLLRFLIISAMLSEGCGSLNMSRWLTFSNTLWWTGWLWVCVHLKQPWRFKLSLEFILFSFDLLMWTKMYLCPGLFIHFFVAELSDSFHFRQKNHFIYDLYLDMSKFYSFLRSGQPQYIITSVFKLVANMRIGFGRKWISTWQIFIWIMTLITTCQWMCFRLSFK